MANFLEQNGALIWTIGWSAAIGLLAISGAVS